MVSPCPPSICWACSAQHLAPDAAPLALPPTDPTDLPPFQRLHKPGSAVQAWRWCTEVVLREVFTASLCLDLCLHPWAPRSLVLAAHPSCWSSESGHYRALSLSLQIVTLIVWCAGRFFLYTSYYSIFGALFGYTNFGRMVAIDNTINGLFGLLQLPLTNWGLHGLGGNFTAINIIQVSLLDNPCSDYRRNEPELPLV